MTLDLVVAAVAAVAAGVRWLRVAQREHYIAGSTSRFARRWWFQTMPNPVAALVAVVGLVDVPAGARLVAWGVIIAGPARLGLKGRTAPLAWTARLRRLAGAAGAVTAAAVAGAAVTGEPRLVVVAVALVPVWIDLGLAGLAPLERRLGDRWVAQAASALARSGSRIVGVTGSYGKTSTKVMIAHLVSAVVPAVASPASFNNRMGLARAINEGLAPGTEVFVAEMGIFGPGEIADLCSWIPPEVGVITAIGPVHLERMRSEENIADAKREILDEARVGVLNVDHPLLARMADEEQGRIEIVRCSSFHPAADVFADPETGSVTVAGSAIGTFDPAANHAGNVACAVGAVVGLGLDPAAVGSRLSSLPVAPNRQAVAIGAGGFTIIDDTFNSNPAGARAALAKLRRLGGGRRVLVTPGMVELGARQAEENRMLAADAAAVVTDLVVVGRTNRAPLLRGAEVGGLSSVIVVEAREEAVAWVKANLGPGDAVLYENDLPDHHP